MERSSAPQLPRDQEHSTGELVKMMSEQISVLEQTREQLGQTVEELTAKADVKARARAKAATAKAKVQAKATELSGRVRRSQLARRRWPLAAVVGAVVAGSVAVWRWRKT